MVTFFAVPGRHVAFPTRRYTPLMFERFTDRARRVVVLAQEEARLLNHSYIGTEHILLGLIHEGEGVAGVFRAARAANAVDVILRHLRQVIVNHVSDMRNIDPAGRNIGTNHNPKLAGSKSIHRAVALTLSSIPVEPCHG